MQSEPRVIYEDNPSTVLDASFERIFDRYVVTLALHEYWRNLPEGNSMAEIA